MDAGPLHCLVVDFGECYSKIGDGAEEAPRTIVPSTYARRADDFVMWASAPKSDYYFGYDAYRRDHLVERKSFFGPGPHKTLRPGVSEQVGHFLHSVVLDCFDSAEPTHGAVLMLDKPDSCVAAKRELAATLFESSKCSKFLMMPDYVATLYSTGKSTGSVLSCGYSSTYAAVVMNGVPSPLGIASVGRGARAVEEAYGEVLRDLLHREKHPDHKWVSEVETRRFLEQHALCRQTDSPPPSADQTTTVRLPDGTAVAVETLSLTAPFEAYFEGTAAAETVNRLLLTATDSISRYQRDVLLQNLVVEGGVTKSVGFFERTAGDLAQRVGPKAKLQSGSDRLLLPWTGAAKLKDWVEDSKLWFEKSALQDKGMERVLAEVARSY